MVGLCLVAVASARADGPEATGTGPIARARRLIEAGDHAAALTVLEDAVLEAQGGERPAILDLLRQSYEVMARRAEASGRIRDAAHYRDNLAILNRSREFARPAQPAKSKPEPPVRPKPAPGGPISSESPGGTGFPPVSENATGKMPVPPGQTSSGTVQPRPRPMGTFLPGLPPASAPATLSEPAPLPEPAKVSPLEVLPSLPSRPAPANSSMAGMTRVPGSIVPRATDPGTGGEGAVVSGVELPLGSDPGTARLPSVESDSHPTPPASPERLSSGPGLDEADRLFEARRYDEAGRGYAALACQNRLPANRREHWAYCRWVGVVRRINTRPASTREWDEIEAEVQSIQRLTPNNWYGEYLRSKVAEARQAGRRASAPSHNLVIRGSAPDEADSRRLPRLFGKPGGRSVPQPERAASPPSAPPASEQPLNLAGTAAQPDAHRAQDDVGSAGANRVSTGADPDHDSEKSRDEDPTPAGDEAAASSRIHWQIHETPNFRIYHCDPRLAQRAAQTAESVRAVQAKRWGNVAARGPWIPRCDLYLYPTPKDYAQATGQPEISPGISTMSNNGTRLLSRRMNLRADNPQLLTTILPHEVTHIVLADLFVVQQIPRWADEGIAVLAEPLREQHLRAAELQGPLESGQLFDLAQLMAMDYPDAKDWSLYYAQSVSLTRYLVEQGPPEKFIRFVRDSQRIGPQAALRDVYQIGGLPELQERWLSYARNQVAAATASRRESESRPERAERR